MTTSQNGSGPLHETPARHPTASRPGLSDAPSDEGDELDTALDALQAPASAATGAKRGRKPGSATPSAHERLQKQLAAIELAKAEVKRLEQETAQRTANIVGAALLDLAERDDGIRRALLGHLRSASLTPSELREIAHLFVSK